MGSSSSSMSSVAPVLPGGIEALSAHDVAARVKSLGKAYEPYAVAIEENGVNGTLLNAITADSLEGLFADLGVASSLHQTKLTLEFDTLKQQAGGTAAAVTTGATKAEAESRDPSFVSLKSDRGAKRFLAFLSHFKEECGSEARIVQNDMQILLGPGHPSFLDSDDLFDLRTLLEDVKDSQVLVLFQSAGVLTRPWCLLELYTAITNSVPIVALNVQGPNSYDYGAAEAILTHLDTELDRLNPGASKLITSHGVDMTELAYLLAHTIPNCISIDFNPRGSRNNIEASIKDLIAAIDVATAHDRPSASKEEWLAQRPAPRFMGSARAHGAAVGKSTSLPGQASALATVPLSVPDLPASFMNRAQHLDDLKRELLGEQAKVLAYGMGGAGKTTVAASLVRDPTVLQRFDKIVWVSLGQAPDLRASSESIHAQLTDRALDAEATTPELIRSRLRDAARESGSVLLVLDDVWDSKHAKEFDCLDHNSAASGEASKLLVTSRIRGLLGKAAEVNVGDLSKEDALTLLLRYAEEEGLQAGSEEHARAMEITTLCGKLPLTLAIVGGMVKHNQTGFAPEIASMLQADLGSAKDEEGVSVEDRIIASSMSMIKKRDDAAVLEKVFEYFAIFPEDCEVSKAVIDAFSHSLVGKDVSVAKAKTTVASAIGTLLNYVLLNGSLATGSGVVAHDIVRDFIISKHTTDALREKQKGAVETLLAARPPKGFCMTEAAQPGTFEHYVAVHLSHHMKGALKAGELPFDNWLTHRDAVVKAACAQAVGHENLKKMSIEAEAKKGLELAARLSWCGYMLGKMGRLSVEDRFDETYRTADLLFRLITSSNKATKDKLRGWAIDAHQCACMGDAGSERCYIAQKRMQLLVNPPPTCSEALGAALGKIVMGSECCKKLLVCCAIAATSGGNDTYDSHISAGLALQFKAMQEWGIMGGPNFFKPDRIDDKMFQAGVHTLTRVAEHMKRARELARNPVEERYPILNIHANVAYIFCGLHCDTSEYDTFTIESEIVEAVSEYDFTTDFTVEKSMAFGDSNFMNGHIILGAIFKFGNLSIIDIWSRKALAGFDSFDIAASKSCSQAYMEMYCTWSMTLPLLLILGKEAVVYEFARVFGFDSWEETGWWECWVNTVLKSDANGDGEDYEWDWGFNLILSAPEGAIDVAAANAWMDKLTPEQRIKGCRRIYNMRLGTWCFESTTARVYLKLGRDDDAYRMCQLALTPEHNCTKRFVLTQCHNILGQVAARRGSFDEANGHYERSLETAKQSGLPLFELLAARDWKKHVLEPDGRSMVTAEAAINAACASMGKTRERLASLLL